MLRKLRGILYIIFGLGMAILAARELVEGLDSSKLLRLGIGVTLFWWGWGLVQSDGDESDPQNPFRASAGFYRRLFIDHGPNSLLLVGANIAVFVYVNGLHGFAESKLPRYLALRFGAEYVPPSGHLEYWRTVTALFLHSDFLHLLGNMIVLWQVGRVVDYFFGTKRFYLIYFASGLFAEFASLAIHSTKGYSLGASGCISGLFGAMVVGMISPPKDREMPAWSFLNYIFLVFMLGRGLMASASDIGVDNVAHFVGFVSGFGLAFATVEKNVSFATLRNSFVGLCLIGAIGAQAAVLHGYEPEVPGHTELAASLEEFKRLILLWQRASVAVDHGKISNEAYHMLWKTRVKPQFAALRTTIYQIKTADLATYDTQLKLYRVISYYETNFTTIMEGNRDRRQRVLASGEDPRVVSDLQSVVHEFQ